MWHAIQGTVLTDQPDKLVWRWSSDGLFSTSSAYLALQQGSQAIPGCIQIWETWAPPRVKLFLWLSIRRSQWTADRRRKRGLETRDLFYLCDQQAETIDHIVVDCPSSKQIWHAATSALGSPLPQQPTRTLLEWRAA